MIITVIRTVILYIFITIGIRIMGKRQIGDMQPNELVVTLLISEIAALPLQDPSQPILNGIIAVFVLVILEILISFITMKSYAIRKLMNGKSVIVIEHGKIDQKAMKKLRMTVLDLVELLRGQNVFDISTVAFAVLEVNGDLNVLLKSDFQPATVSDLSLKSQEAQMQIPVISDGKIIADAVSSINKTSKEIKEILNSQSVTEANVFLMTMSRDGKMNIICKEKKS
ncbi:MAG: DUF421 domain-containing protein [Ruminococcaceae bacterium]|nr:DUF421 domain-containing protein [Oscillospiraceae bacterium]